MPDQDLSVNGPVIPFVDSSRRQFLQSATAVCGGCLAWPHVSALAQADGDEGPPPECGNFFTGEAEPPAENAKTKGMAALDKLWTWAGADHVLKVRFMNGQNQSWYESVHARVREIAPLWSHFASVKFEFVNQGDAHIRINFTLGDERFDSTIGNDATKREPDKASMNLVFVPGRATKYGNNDNELYRHYILHEFGHALGFYHEHQQPNVIQWDVAKLQTYAKKKWGWEKEKVEEWILREAAANRISTPFDINSVMMYEYPPELSAKYKATGTAFSSIRHGKLTLWDKIVAAMAYPGSPGQAGVVTLVPGRPEVKAEVTATIRVARFRLRITEAGNYRVNLTGAMPVMASLSQNIPVANGGGVEIIAAVEKDEGQPAKLEFGVTHPPADDWKLEIRHAKPIDGVGEGSVSFEKV